MIKKNCYFFFGLHAGLNLAGVRRQLGSHPFLNGGKKKKLQTHLNYNNIFRVLFFAMQVEVEEDLVYYLCPKINERRAWRIRDGLLYV